MGSGTNYLKYVVVGVLVLGIGLVVWRNLGPSDNMGGVKEIVAPEQLTAAASLGKKSFYDNCAQCHGANLGGTEKGPPLVHDYYNPGHHADGAFYVAVRNGVKQHHWRFGNMPAQPHITEDQIRTIVAYVREVQEANGIVYKPH